MAPVLFVLGAYLWQKLRQDMFARFQQQLRPVMEMNIAYDRLPTPLLVVTCCLALAFVSKPPTRVRTSTQQQMPYLE